MAFSRNYDDFPTELQTFLKRFNISYFPKFKSFHREDTDKDKEDINRRMNNLEDQLDNIRSNYQRDIESSQKCSSDVESGERIQLRIMQQEQTGSTLLWYNYL